MLLKIEIPTSIIEKSVDLALSEPRVSRGDFFHEIRAAFKRSLGEIFASSGLGVKDNETLGYTNYLRQGTQLHWNPIVKFQGWNKEIRTKLDLEFCNKYGHDDYSLRAINYTDRVPANLPALTSLSGVFSLGNIVMLVENTNCELEVTLGDSVFAVGCAYHISKRKKKSYFCLLGIWFDPELINSIIQSKLENYEENKDDLDEIRLGTNSYPMLYINRITGDLYTCSCFEEHLSVSSDIERFLPFGNSEEGLKDRVRNIGIADGVCHFCSGGMPKQEYGHSMYYSSFMQRHLPYHTLLSRMTFDRDIYEGEEYRQIENELREKFGYPKIGERWVTETTLFKMVSAIMPDHEVIHHYRGAELDGLEIDIWLPELQLGIEYQGEQHYKVIEHWGGKEGLEKRMANDRKKKKLCQSLGYSLIEVKYSEELSEERIKQKIDKALRDKSNRNLET